MTEKEIWKDIEGYEGLYKVSTLGRIYSNKAKGRFLKLITNEEGYLNVNLYKHRKSQTKRVHRLEALAFIPNPENKPQINHKDGIKNNNKLGNLEWCTSEENTQHAVRVGLINTKGVNHYCSKVTEKEVVEIRSMQGQRSQREIGELYGLHRSVIGRIHTRNIWKHI